MLRRIAKGDTFEGHVDAASRAHAAGMELSVIALLGIGGVALREGEDAHELGQQHARATADLVTAMDPAFFSALTVTVVPGTPLHTLQRRDRFHRTAYRLVARRAAHHRRPGRARRTRSSAHHHASNYLPLAGRLPRDRERIVAVIDQALAGQIPLRPEVGARAVSGAPRPRAHCRRCAAEVEVEVPWRGLEARATRVGGIGGSGSA